MMKAVNGLGYVHHVGVLKASLSILGLKRKEEHMLRLIYKNSLVYVQLERGGGDPTFHKPKSLLPFPFSNDATKWVLQLFNSK